MLTKHMNKSFSDVIGFSLDFRKGGTDIIVIP